MDYPDMSGGFSEGYPSDSAPDNAGQSTPKSTPRRFPVINLAHSTILESAFRSLPIDIIRRYKALPFCLDKDRKTISIACVDPGDTPMIDALGRHLPGLRLELFQAELEDIDRLIDRLSPPPQDMPPTPPTLHESAKAAKGDDSPLYESLQGSLTEDTLVVATRGDDSPDYESLRDSITDQDFTGEEKQSKPDPVSVNRKVVLFITQSGRISQHLMFSLSAERLTPRVVQNVDAALTEIQTQNVDCVFVEKSLRSKCDSFIRQLRVQRPSVTVRFYTTEAALLLNNTSEDVSFELFQKNLQLLRHLTSGEKSAAAHHAVAVARLADAICTRLNLPGHLRQVVTTAASLHNLAEENLTSTDGFDRADIIGLSAGRLAGWDYPPLVVQMLRCMYREGSPVPSKSSGIDKFGGSILTAADCFCHNWPDASGISARQLGQVEQKLQKLVGASVGPDVLSALIDAICDDLTAQMLRHSPFRVHLFISRGSLSAGLEAAFHSANFALSHSQSIDECAKFCRRYGPRTLVIRDSGSTQDVYDVIIGLAVRGVALDQLCTILLLENDIVAEATRLLKHGVEDVLPVDADAGAIIAKLQRIHTRIDDSTKQRLAVLKELGTHGTLEDMSLIDLLEVWRTNKRPVRIEVSASSDHLTVYVDRGRIIHAQCGNDVGADAILRGMAWQRGVWSIEAVDPAELPTPNIDQDIDSVLLEACVRLDKASLLDKA
jgi:hypothetical protein